MPGSKAASEPLRSYRTFACSGLLRPDRTSLIAVVTVVIALVACGCAGGNASVERRPFRLIGKTRAVAVSPAEAFRVATTAATVAGAPGAVSQPGKVNVTPVELQHPPSEIGNVPADSVAPGVLVEFSSTKVAAPVKVVFNDVPLSSAAIAVHVSDKGKWTPIESTRDGTNLIVETTEFSVISWVRTKVFDPVVSYVEEQLTGRSSPVPCEGAPVWASVTPPPSGTLHSCVRAAPDGSGTAELDLKSNRGSFQIVDLPTGPPRRYVWVEDQPDPLRALAGIFTSNQNQVLLPPQKRMTVGYDRPFVVHQVPFNSEVSHATILLSAVGWAINYMAGEAHLASQLGPLYCAQILQFDPRGATGTIDGVKISGPALSRQLWECALDYLDTIQKHPEQILTHVQEVTGQSFSPDDATKLSTKVKIATKVTAVLTLGGIAFQAWTMVFDQLVNSLIPDNVDAATLTLDGKNLGSRPPVTLGPATPAVCPGDYPPGYTARVRGVAEDDVLNLRSEPSAQSPIAATARNGVAVLVIENETARVGGDAWVMVGVPPTEGQEFEEPLQNGCAWVNSAYLTDK